MSYDDERDEIEERYWAEYCPECDTSGGHVPECGAYLSEEAERAGAEAREAFRLRMTAGRMRLARSCLG